MIDPYLYPGTTVLRNRLDLRDDRALDEAERLLVTQRVRSGIPTGHFDQRHIQAIHRHLFQDIYAWAGKLRTLNMSKGTSNFLECTRIPTGLADVHRQVAAAGHMRDITRPDLARHLAQLIGDLNFVHPFREGNGRTQLQYARLLADRAGQVLNLSALSGQAWLAASQAAIDTDYKPMEQCFDQALAA